MQDTTVTLKEAKARLSELVELAASGERVVITKHGKPVIQLSGLEKSFKPVNAAELRRLTDALPEQKEDAATLTRRLREDARY